MGSKMYIWTYVLFILLEASCQVCKITNVQIDKEDGRQQFMELSVKKVDANEEKSCPGCNLSEDSKAGYQHHTRHWAPSPPTFSLVLQPSELINECETDDNELPYGLCMKKTKHNENHESVCNNQVCVLEDIEDLAEAIEENNLLPWLTGDKTADHMIAVGIVYLNLGNIDKAIEEFSSIILAYPSATLAYFGRGAAYYRKGIQNGTNAAKALSDFTQAIKLKRSYSRPDVYIHRAEALLTVHQYQQAYGDITSALKIQSSPKAYFLRGVISLLLENFDEAETDFRKNLQSKEEKWQKLSHFNLGTSLYYQGKVRNAVEVFKEVLKAHPDHVEASLSLAQGFKDLANLRAALRKFNHTLSLQPSFSLLHQLRGNMFYECGDLNSALPEFELCTDLDQKNAVCHYTKGASKIMLGQFYGGLKDTTKVMVSHIPSMKASPEYIKAHYLREYARYMHAHLDSPITSLQPDMDFSPDYLDHWVKLKAFDFKNYKEQPGLQPDIGDVFQMKEIPTNLKQLICRAEDLGRLAQVSVDGIIPNRRHNLAMGLASVHMAQFFEAKWKGLRASKNGHDKIVHSWKELYSIAIYYRRLANLEEPYLWVETLPDYTTKDGYRADIPFVRGPVINTCVAPYYELAFKLIKSMLEHFSGEGKNAALNEEISKATTCSDLLNAAKRWQINPHGFLVSTQVPSMQQLKDDHRLDGGVLILTEDLSSKIVFTLNIANTPDRTASYAQEMDHLLNLLQEEIKKSNANKNTNIEVIVTHILTITYYFYNLLPLTGGTSAVAYSVMLGLLLSVGRQITGRIPHGRLLDMEAMLSGAPDAFVMVAKNWMLIKKNTLPVSNLPKVWEVLPTVRHVMEVLSVNATSC